MTVEVTVDAAVATIGQEVNSSVRTVVAQPSAGGPVTSSVRTTVGVLGTVTASFDALIQGLVAVPLVTMDGIVADESGWVKELKKESDWVLLEKPED